MFLSSFEKTAFASALLLFSGGCGDGSGGSTSGDVTVLLEAEDTIVEGLEPGTSGEAIQDGWTVTFERYLVAIGDVDVHLSTDESVERKDGRVFVVDLASVPESGLPLWSFDGLRAGSWEFGYATPGAADGAARDESVAAADYDEMVANDWTYLIEGVMTKPDGQACPPAALAEPGAAVSNGASNAGADPCYEHTQVRFRLGVTAETAFGPCEVDEVPGFAVSGGTTTTIAVTIHGDHLFFNGFPESAEGGVMRLAQWLADADLDLDGEVTRAELENIAPSDLPELDDRYQLGGSPITPLLDMWDYVVGQLKTQGHFQGEGECPFDGVEHMD